MVGFEGVSAAKWKSARCVGAVSPPVHAMAAVRKLWSRTIWVRYPGVSATELTTRPGGIVTRSPVSGIAFSSGESTVKSVSVSVGARSGLMSTWASAD